MCWEKLAKEVEANYESIVNWKERFFICPYCGEVVYEDDWRDEDFAMGRYYDPRVGLKLYCPICENIIIGQEDDEDELNLDWDWGWD